MVKPGYKQTEIGVIPEDWDIKSLQDIVVSPLSYGVNAPAVPYDSNLYRYIRITDITEDGHYSKEDEVSVNILDGEKYCLCKGDILLARTGASTGKTYLYRTQDGKLVYAGFLIRASVDVDNYNPFYSMFLRNFILKDIRTGCLLCRLEVDSLVLMAKNIHPICCPFRK